MSRGGARAGAGRPALLPSERRRGSKRLVVYVTPGELAELVAAADGRSLSKWARERLLNLSETKKGSL